ncbi:MAG: DNA repair exonuclease [Candidatus Methanomethylophilaceae archaeon]|nr:DNA repair exonuclease [Candidatus Methanomethylophilaceae archaeon]
MTGGFTFVHCADLHIGNRKWSTTCDDPRLRDSPKTSFARIVDTALSSDAAFMVISGDVYDSEEIAPSDRLFVCDQLSRFGKPVFICRGNHDCVQTFDRILPYPGNVHEFPTSPDTVKLRVGERSEVVEVTGVSFQSSSDKRNLATMLKGSTDAFTVACVHCNVGSIQEHDDYAPCSPKDLVGRGVDYWALGHIHKGGILSKEPYAVYAGVTQGRTFKETGSKGCYVAKVDSGRVVSCMLTRTAPFTWTEKTIDITGRDMDSILLECHGHRKDEIVRFRFVGKGDLDGVLREHPDDMRDSIRSASGCGWCELQVDSMPRQTLVSGSGSDLPAAVMRSAERLKQLGRERTIEKLCENPNMAPFRNRLMEMSDEEFSALVDRAAGDAVNALERVS